MDADAKEQEVVIIRLHNISRHLRLYENLQRNIEFERATLVQIIPDDYTSQATCRLLSCFAFIMRKLIRSYKKRLDTLMAT